jgi:pimeloyl-ACP methyl ester carboxylesterase
MRGNAAMRELWDEAVSKLEDPVDAAFVYAFQLSTLAIPIARERLDLFVGESLKVPARVWKAAVAAHLDTDHSSRLHEIEAPTLILWGKRDALCSRSDQTFLKHAIPGARFVEYPDGGHAIHWEDPARFAADLVGFTRQIGESVPAGVLAVR